MSVPAPSDRRSWAGRPSLGKRRTPWGFTLAAVRHAERGLFHVAKALVEPYMVRKRRGAVAGERLAQAMLRYAELCMSAGKTPRDLQEADSYLDKAAALYTEIGQPEKAAEALALKPRGRSR